MSIARARAEIATDPLGKGYAAMTDKQVADDLNAKTRTKLVPIPSTKLPGRAAGNGWFQIICELAADTTKPGSLRSVARSAEKMSSLDTASLDLSNPDNMALVDMLVMSGALRAIDKKALVKLGTVQISRAEELGLDLTREGEIQQARMR